MHDHGLRFRLLQTDYMVPNMNIEKMLIYTIIPQNVFLNGSPIFDDCMINDMDGIISNEGYIRII